MCLKKINEEAKSQMNDLTSIIEEYDKKFDFMNKKENELIEENLKLNDINLSQAKKIENLRNSVKDQNSDKEISKTKTTNNFYEVKFFLIFYFKFICRMNQIKD